jgi:hypothetical protein
MSDPERKALLLVGSAKPVGSGSEILGRYLADRLAQRHWHVEAMRIVSRLGAPKRTEAMLESAGQVDLVILSFGLYMDSPPAPVILLMEKLWRYRAARGIEGGRLAAIVNCGMPDASAAAGALPFVERFTQKARIHYAGGLAMGMSEMIAGRALEELGTMARRLRGALDQAGQALAEGKDIDPETAELFARPLVPRWLFLWLGMKRWQNQGA